MSASAEDKNLQPEIQSLEGRITPSVERARWAWIEHRNVIGQPPFASELPFIQSLIEAAVRADGQGRQEPQEKEQNDLGAQCATAVETAGNVGEGQLSHDASPLVERLIEENRILNDALRALLYYGGLRRNQTPCPVCLWPLPADIDHHICDCCGIQHGYEDLASYKWNEVFWSLGEPHTPKIIDLLYTRIARLERDLQIGSVSDTSDAERADDRTGAQRHDPSSSDHSG